MGGVAKQRYPTFGLLKCAAHWRSVAQRPKPPGWAGLAATVRHRLNQVAQRSGGALGGDLQIRTISAVVPALQIACYLALHDCHHIEQFTTAHWVMHHMQPGAEPDRHLLAA